MELQKKLIAFGDSVMKGVFMENAGMDGKPHYVIARNTFIEEFGRRLGCDVSNYGKIGSTVTAGQMVIDTHIKDVTDSSCVLLEYGGNDSDFDWASIADAPEAVHAPRTPLTLFAQTYRGIIDRIRNCGSKPIILSLPPLCSKRYFEHFTKNMDLKRKGNVLDWLGGTFETISSWHESYNLKLFNLVPLWGYRWLTSRLFFLQRGITAVICAATEYIRTRMDKDLLLTPCAIISARM